MQYRGRLNVSGDRGEGIPVVMTIDDVYLNLTSDGEDLGTWRLDAIETARMAGDRFSLVLAGEQMVFSAEDPLGYTYNGITTIEEVARRLGKRRSLFRGRRSRRTAVPSGAAAVPRNEPAAADSDSGEGLSQGGMSLDERISAATGAASIDDVASAVLEDGAVEDTLEDSKDESEDQTADGPIDLFDASADTEDSLYVDHVDDDESAIKWVAGDEPVRGTAFVTGADDEVESGDAESGEIEPEHIEPAQSDDAQSDDAQSDDAQSEDERAAADDVDAQIAEEDEVEPSPDPEGAAEPESDFDSEDDAAEDDAAEDDAAEDDAAEDDAAEDDAAEDDAGPDVSGLDELGSESDEPFPDERGEAEVDGPELEASHVETGEPDRSSEPETSDSPDQESDESGSDESGSDESGPDESGADESGADEIASGVTTQDDHSLKLADSVEETGPGTEPDDSAPDELDEAELDEGEFGHVIESDTGDEGDQPDSDEPEGRVSVSFEDVLEDWDAMDDPEDAFASLDEVLLEHDESTIDDQGFDESPVSDTPVVEHAEVDLSEPDVDAPDLPDVDPTESDSVVDLEKLHGDSVDEVSGDDEGGAADESGSDESGEVDPSHSDDFEMDRPEPSVLRTSQLEPKASPSEATEKSREDEASPTGIPEAAKRQVVVPQEKPRLFGRRGRKQGSHKHDYQESKTVGGITRRVCADCGHVSFEGTDVYDGWT